MDLRRKCEVLGLYLVYGYTVNTIESGLGYRNVGSMIHECGFDSQTRKDCGALSEFKYLDNDVINDRVMSYLKDGEPGSISSLKEFLEGKDYFSPPTPKKMFNFKGLACIFAGILILLLLLTLLLC